MKIILIKNVEKLGKRGDIVEVADGYARNYLIPGNLAKKATDKVISAYEREKHLEEKRKEKRMSSSKEMSEKLEGKVIKYSVKAGDRDKVFGSITKGDITDSLVEMGYDIDRRQIILEENIKSLGEYDVELDLGEGVKASIKVVIEREK